MNKKKILQTQQEALVNYLLYLLIKSNIKNYTTTTTTCTTNYITTTTTSHKKHKGRETD